MFLFLGHMAVVWLFVRGKWHRVRWSNSILTMYARFGLRVLKIQVNPLGLENLVGIENGLFVGNHLSYIDVLVFHSRLPACFVTSMEVKRTPVLGQVCQLAGCLFVERRNKQNILNEIGEISSGLQAGLNVAIFPEATSSNGEQILRFRRPLYVAAIDAKKPVMPFCLNYRRVGNAPINLKTRDKIFWYGDMDFVSHLWALAGSGGVEVEINYLAAIHPAPVDDATALAQKSQDAVEKVFLKVQA